METKVKNREWVKNAAIIFLAVLLVLTFFSNTIMNRSLPEAAAVYVQSGAITAMVRGQGTVESLGSYEVKAPETREIRAVMIRAGQEVEAGDVLFVLGNGDSAEIEAAQEQLRQLKLNYSQTAAGSSNYGAKLAAAQTRYNNAVAAEAHAKALAGDALNIDALEKRKSDLTNAEVEYKSAKSKALQSISSALSALDSLVASARIHEVSEAELWNLNEARYSISNAAECLSSENESEYSASMANSLLGDEGGSAKTCIESFYSNNIYIIESNYEMNDLYNVLARCVNQSIEYIAGKASNDGVINKLHAYNEAINSYNNEQSEYDGKHNELVDDYNEAVAERKTAEAALKALQESASDYSQQAALTGITLQDLKYQIERAQEKLDKLTGGADNQITSNVSGTVSSVSVNAGTTASKDQVLAVIDVPDMGYTLSYSVTNDQAQRLHIGDTATVTSYYWGSRIDATLTAVKPDQKDPQSKRILEFEVSGDVTPGAQLTISIGARSQNYDLIVPNSAIRSDSNGKFVLAVDARNSALGNRYFARRVDVEIIANDDNNSAVTGALNYGDFVITTTSAPLKSGEQFRMAEG